MAAASGPRSSRTSGAIADAPSNSNDDVVTNAHDSSSNEPLLDPAVEDERLRAVLQDAHLNFLVGAGTSSRLFAPLGDIEVALTDLEQWAAEGSAYEIARASIQALFFDAVIWPNVSLISARDADAAALISSYQRFATALNRLLLSRRSTLLEKRVSLFTTNVDLSLEVAFDGLGVELNDGFVGRFVPTFDPGSFGSVRHRSSPRYGHRSEIPTFDLIKLHGSVGWRWHHEEPGEAPRISFEHDLAAVHKVKASLDTLRTSLVTLESATPLSAEPVLKAARELERPETLGAFLDAYDALVIVYPEKTKFATTVLTETYYELIRRFANDLERETSVLFVHGFSFRDEHLRQIVTRAARSNPTLLVYICCYTADEEARYRALLPDKAVPNGNIEYLAPQDDATKFDLDAIVDRFLLPTLDDVAPAAPRIGASQGTA